MAPVDHWKTSFMAVLYPLYIQYKTRALARIAVFGSAENQAAKRVVQAREVVETNPVLNALGVKKPIRASDWGGLSFTLDRRGEVLMGNSMKAFGIGGQCQGWKFDLIIFDDVADVKNSSTDNLRKKLEYKFLREQINRLVEVPAYPLDKSRAISICTSLHEDDLNHKMYKGFEEGSSPHFEVVKRRAIYYEDEYDDAPEFVQVQIDRKKFTIKRTLASGEVESEPIGLLFPEKFPYPNLMEKKSKSKKFWAQNYLQEPLSDEDYTINIEWIEAAFDKTLILGPALWFDYLLPLGYVLYFVFDPAIVRTKAKAQKKNSDYWVMEARAYLKSKDHRVVVDYRRDRGARKWELLQEAISFYNLFKFRIPDNGRILVGQRTIPDPVWVVENNAAQDFLVQDMEDIFGKSFVRGVASTHVSKNDGFIGLPAVSYAYEQNAITLPAGNNRSLKHAERKRDEWSRYGQESRHDDVATCDLLAEFGLGRLRGKIKNIDPNILKVKTRGSRNFTGLMSTKDRYARRRNGTR